MAAEAVLEGGAGAVKVDLYDAMPSVGRKFLLAGKGGLNLTHSEPWDTFLSRFGEAGVRLSPLLNAFDAGALRAWAGALGIETFIGSSGRVFPAGMKAAPLLRAWLQRLRAAGLAVHVRHRFRGFRGDAAAFDTPRGEHTDRANAVVLALGGGSWPQLGSDGAWVRMLAERGVPISPLRPANCGFEVRWSEHMKTRFAGAPVKTVVASFVDSAGHEHRQSGDLVVTATGIEGGPIYALSAPLRDRLDAAGTATVHLDLAPGRELQRLGAELGRPRGRRSLSSHIQSRVGLTGVKMALLREVVPAADLAEPQRLAAAIKALPLQLVATRPLAEAISTAGGVKFEALDQNLMLRAMPGVFCAGEMLDWEAPTGGYLLTACFATGRAAGSGALAWLKVNK